ncbi:MAG: hypothetical protein H6742_06210 [Alphaproteobacteria bacterium]|nr:hypothetical protein [Alphaproteobacteria bacterium]
MITLLALLWGCQAGSTVLDSGAVGTDDGATDAGSTDDGSTDDGSTDDGGTDGSTSDGGVDSGDTTDGGTDDGGADDGGTDSGGSDGGGDTGDTTPDPPPDLRELGPYSVSTRDGSTAVSGCDMAWTRYDPAGVASPPTVLLGHGFVRNRGVLADVAEHFSSWGLQVYAVDFCHSSIWDTDHTANGEELAAVAASLGIGAPLYAGHSAGGLAALVAASEDAGAAGVVGLDPVDAFDEGITASGLVRSPAYAIVGEPSTCNSSSNGVAMYGGVPRHTVLRATEADHCDFEGPTDWVCTIACTGRNDLFTDEEISATVRGLATAALLDLSGVDARADAWWEPGGEWYDLLLDDGAISVP